MSEIENYEYAVSARDNEDVVSRIVGETNATLKVVLVGGLRDNYDNSVGGCKCERQLQLRCSCVWVRETIMTTV